ncbi:hypothetical protein [Neobacillus drentensis]|uniref:hypothetical protein n=1 Tax=Neobacillus drentensis TaxID=220684 RepID=UPI0030032B1F
MNIMIEIHYKTDIKSVQYNSIPLKGRKPEQIALQWWKQIKKEMSYRAELEKVIVDGDKDITELVKELEKQDLKRIMNDNLPF